MDKTSDRLHAEDKDQLRGLKVKAVMTAKPSVQPRTTYKQSELTPAPLSTTGRMDNNT